MVLEKLGILDQNFTFYTKKGSKWIINFDIKHKTTKHLVKKKEAGYVGSCL